MKKSLWRTFLLVVVLAGFAALTFAAPQAQAPKKYKLTLENGKVIEGEIVAITATTISIKDAALGVIAIARENILKIEPPLDETKPVVAPPTQTPAPRVSEQPPAAPSGGGGIQFGFSLSGGMGNIDGGDFNAAIRDYNAFYADYNDYLGANYYTIDWKEMKWLTKFGGEVYARFGKYFGVGLGVEFIKKTNPGTINYVYEDSWSQNWFGVGYIVFDDNHYLTDTYSQTLTVTPITLSLYGFLPLGANAEAYVKAGAGYYLGKLTSELVEDWNWYYNENWYWNSGTPWPPHYHQTGEGTYTESFEATCNTMGFHFGAGFNYNIANNFALFAEVFYRVVNFKDWEGSGNWDLHYVERWGNTDSTSLNNLPNSLTITGDDSYDGKLWSFDDIWSSLNQGSYLKYGAYETGDEPEESSITENVRATEINLNGFTFKVGIKIFFGGR